MTQTSTESKHIPRDYLKKILAGSLLITFLFSGNLLYADPSKPLLQEDAIQIRGGISVGVKGEEVIPSISLRDADIKDILYSLSEQAGFNLIVDESVQGTINLDLKDISVNKIMEYIMTLADLSYYKDGNTFIITSTDTADTKSLNKLVLKSIRVRYSNAKDLADVLNSTVFSINRPGGNKAAIATADERTNSILIMGNEDDIDLANRALAELDFPLQHKTFFLKNAPAMDVANTISQTLFSVSLSAGSSGGSGGGSSGGSAGGESSSGGGGGGSAGGGGGGGAAGGDGGGAAGGGGGGAAGGGVQVMKGGPVTFIANTINNTLTLIGTTEQLQLIESMLYEVDVKPAQVAIQLSLVKLTHTRGKKMNVGVNETGGRGRLYSKSGNLGLGFTGPNSFFSWDSTAATRVGHLIEQLNFETITTNTKAKILANPTIIAVSGTASSINVTDEVVGGTSIVQDNETGDTTTTITKQSVGISLSITPEVFPDGTVTMNITPTVSAPSGKVEDDEGNSIDLISSDSLAVAKVRVKDGQTLVLGGLLRENSTSNHNKVPFLSDIPIIGTLFKSSQENNNSRTELIVMVTPHIIKEEGVPYFRKEWKDQISYGQNSSDNQSLAGNREQNGIIPTADDKKGISPSNMQTLEQREQDSSDKKGIKPEKSSLFPLSTYSEVLK